MQQSKVKPLSDEDLKISQANSQRALKALNSSGEAGLDKELDRLFPGSENPSRRNSRAAQANKSSS